MLAGCTRSSTFSPASTCPLAASSSTHECDCLGCGAAGTGMLSLSAPAAGVSGFGAGSCAMAKPTTEVNRTASNAPRAVDVAFIDNMTPGEDPPCGGVEEDEGLFAHDLRLAESQTGHAGRQFRDLRAGDRANAHAPDRLAGGHRVEQARTGHAG